MEIVAGLAISGKGSSIPCAAACCQKTPEYNTAPSLMPTRETRATNAQLSCHSARSRVTLPQVPRSRLRREREPKERSARPRRATAEAHRTLLAPSRTTDPSRWRPPAHRLSPLQSHRRDQLQHSPRNLPMNWPAGSDVRNSVYRSMKALRRADSLFRATSIASCAPNALKNSRPTQQ